MGAEDVLLSRNPLFLTNNCCLCSEHFEIDQFTNKESKNQLKWDAVSILFKVPNPPKQLSMHQKLLMRTTEDISTQKAPKQHKSNVIVTMKYYDANIPSPSNTPKTILYIWVIFS